MTLIPASAQPRWGVVVPVKVLSVAKSRLAPFGERRRQELALAFAADVVLAATAVAPVVVVTDDRRAGEELAGLGAEVVADLPDAGLNAALVHGAQVHRAHDPGCGLVTVSSDLPALRPDDLRSALAAVPAGGRAFAADLHGHGTTLLAASPGTDLAPAFGSGSRATHVASGAMELVVAPGLRCDVDTPADLHLAMALGVGPRTKAVAAAMGLTTEQATVRTWSPEGGTAFLADGAVRAFGPDAWQAGLWRMLRIGQRVRLVQQDGRVLAVGLP